MATGLEDMAAAVGLGLRRSTQLLGGPLRRGTTPAPPPKDDRATPAPPAEDTITAPIKDKEAIKGEGEADTDDDGAQEVIDAPADSKV